jgi:hypothetical protein
MMQNKMFYNIKNKWETHVFLIICVIVKCMCVCVCRCMCAYVQKLFKVVPCLM